MTGLVLAALMHCGTERWGAKTLSDGTLLRFNPVSTTVASLVARPHENHGRSDPRSPGVETTLFRVHALLLGYKQENDEDFHIVIGDGSNTMIVEVPNSTDCVANHDPVLRRKMMAVRDSVERLGGQSATPSMYWIANPPRVVVTGFGLFDFFHHQTGVAPNVIELHPVLRIEAAP